MCIVYTIQRRSSSTRTASYASRQCHVPTSVQWWDFVRPRTTSRRMPSRTSSPFHRDRPRLLSTRDTVTSTRLSHLDWSRSTCIRRWGEARHCDCQQCSNCPARSSMTHFKNPKSARITWPLTLTLTLSTHWMHADLETIVCKFGGDPAICLREEAICAKVYRRTDRQTTDAAPLH